MKAILTTLITLVSTAALADTQINFQRDTYVIPVDSTSCGSLSSGNIKSPMFQVNNLSVTNDSDDKLQIVALKVSINESLGYVCQIGDDELEVMGLATVIQPHTSLSATCDLRCGGVRVASGSKHPAVVTVLGVLTDSKGNETPVRASRDLSVNTFELKVK
jgi:hypothetical protein